MTAVDSPIVFRSDDVADFAAATGDVNPLHVSADYAHRTPYGEPVVHGVLVALAALARLPAPEGRAALSHVSAVFSSPTFCDTRYVLTTHGADNTHSAVLSDGSVPLARVTAQFDRRPGSQNRLRESEPRFSRQSARKDFEPASAAEATASGDWSPAAAPLRSLLRRLGLELPLDQAAVLGWCSYLAGMELPGRQALLYRVEVDFDADPAEGDRFGYRASVDRFDHRFNRLGVKGELSLGSRPYATASLVTLIRPASEARVGADLSAPVAQDLRGRTAVVVGASRGLGAATVEALARRGASVIGAYRSDHAAAEKLRVRLGGLTGAVHMVCGDLTDPAAAASLLKEADEPDFLICNASPPFQPLRVEPDHVDRILDHINDATRLVAVPLATFLPVLARQSGRVVVISSSFVERPAPTWPHYVAAKQAIEGLVRVASMQYPDVRFLVKRPPVLDTDLAASPIAVERPMAPEAIADAIANWLAAPPPDEVLTIEEQYPASV